MKKVTAYQRREVTQEGIKVYFEFPETTEKDNEIKREVKDILIGLLNEQLKKRIKELGNDAQKIIGKE